MATSTQRLHHDPDHYINRKGLTIVYVGVLFVDADDGLWLWWQITVPLLPLLFLVASGVWRNVCPLATSNQLPRVLNFSRALTPPKWLTEYGFVIGAVAFFLFASSRKWLFNHNGPATGLLIIAAMVSALLGGYLFKGKGGWCSTCQVSKTGLSTKTTSVTFTVTGVARAPLTYKSSANHDPDGDSNGTIITVSKP